MKFSSWQGKTNLSTYKVYNNISYYFEKNLNPMIIEKMTKFFKSFENLTNHSKSRDDLEPQLQQLTS